MKKTIIKLFVVFISILWFSNITFWEEVDSLCSIEYDSTENFNTYIKQNQEIMQNIIASFSSVPKESDKFNIKKQARALSSSAYNFWSTISDFKWSINYFRYNVLWPFQWIPEPFVRDYDKLKVIQARLESLQTQIIKWWYWSLEIKKPCAKCGYWNHDAFMLVNKLIKQNETTISILRQLALWDPNVTNIDDKLNFKIDNNDLTYSEFFTWYDRGNCESKSLLKIKDDILAVWKRLWKDFDKSLDPWIEAIKLFW